MEVGRNLKVLFKRLHKDAIVPTYAFDGDACCDLYSVEGVILTSMERQLICTGIAIQIPPGFEAQIRSRSGLSLRQGLVMVNGVGTIDSQYRGELKLPMINLSDDVVKINKGDRIAQMKFSPVYTGYFLEVDNLEVTNRGVGGFGHTGR